MEDQICEVLEQVEEDIEERWSPEGWGTAHERNPAGTMCLIHSVVYRSTGEHKHVFGNSLCDAVIGQLRDTLEGRTPINTSLGTFNDHHSMDAVKRLVVDTKQRVCK